MKLTKDHFLPGFMLVSSVLLLYFGIPRFLAELMLVPGTPILERMNMGESISDKDLDILQQSREQAIYFVDHPKAYADLGSVMLVRAQKATDKDEKKKAAKQSILYNEKSLSLAPLNTFAWLRLSNAHLLAREKDYRLKAVEAWRKSVVTAPFEPFILLARIHTGILLYDDLTEEDQRTLTAQTNSTYDWNRGKLRTYARQHQLLEWVTFLLEDQEKEAWILEK